MLRKRSSLSVTTVHPLPAAVSGAQVLYHGTVAEMVPYFSRLGYTCPTYTNPADFLFRQVLQAGEYHHAYCEARMQAAPTSSEEASVTAYCQARLITACIVHRRMLLQSLPRMTLATTSLRVRPLTC